MTLLLWAMPYLFAMAAFFASVLLLSLWPLLALFAYLVVGVAVAASTSPDRAQFVPGEAMVRIFAWPVKLAFLAWYYLEYLRVKR